MTAFDKNCHRQPKAAIALLLAATLLTGCGSVTKQTFELSLKPNVSPADNARAEQKKAVQILVANPDALKALDGQNIVVRGGEGSIGYLKGAQWSDRLPSIVQARIAQVFEDTQQLGGVGKPGDGLAINYQIISDIRVFGIDLDASGRFAHVEIAVKILDDKTGNVRRTRVFSAKSPVVGSRNGDYAAALDSAFAIILADIVHWTLAALP